VTTLAMRRTTFSALTDLATCLCSEIATSGLPDVCFCGIIPGEAASAMYSGDCTKKCGMAWVRLVSAFPAAGVGVPSEHPGNCGSGLGFDVEMGMLRCTEIGTATTPPPPAQLLGSAELQYGDMNVMRKAVACCSGSKDWTLQTYTPMGPGGGLVGGFWTLTLWVP
jgi:hypothetical protein